MISGIIGKIISYIIVHIMAIRKMRRRAPARKYKKKGIRRGGQRTTTVNRSLQPFPSRYICKLKYSEAINGVGGPSLSGYGNYQFLANSVWDPNATGIGHSPYGMDQLTLLYNRYRVISCKYVINGSVYNGNTEVNGIIGVLAANEGAVISGGISEFQENPRSKFVAQYVGNEKTLKGNVYIPALVGRTKSQYMADDRYQAQTNASPAENAVMNIYFGFMDGTLATAAADLNITLEYTVEFFDVKKQLQS